MNKGETTGRTLDVARNSRVTFTRVSILNIAMTGVYYRGRLFIAERKGQRHASGSKDRIGILSENPLSDWPRVTSFVRSRFSLGFRSSAANFAEYSRRGGGGDFRVTSKSVLSEIIPVSRARARTSVADNTSRASSRKHLGLG